MDYFQLFQVTHHSTLWHVDKHFSFTFRGIVAFISLRVCTESVHVYKLCSVSMRASLSQGYTEMT